jgi:hypothetical protein
MKKPQDDLLVKIKALEGDKPKDIIDRFYTCLDVIDGKATGLLTVNSILAAYFVAILAMPDAIRNEIKNIASWEKSAVIIVLIGQLGILVISSILCIKIVKISWPFLFHVVGSNYDIEYKKLEEVVHSRAQNYHIARVFTLIVLIVMSLFLAGFVVLILT